MNDEMLQKLEEFEGVTARLAVKAEILIDIATMASDGVDGALAKLVKLVEIHEEMGFCLHHANSVHDELQIRERRYEGGAVEEFSTTAH